MSLYRQIRRATERGKCANSIKVGVRAKGPYWTPATNGMQSQARRTALSPLVAGNQAMKNKPKK